MILRPGAVSSGSFDVSYFWSFFSPKLLSDNTSTLFLDCVLTVLVTKLVILNACPHIWINKGIAQVIDQSYGSFCFIYRSQPTRQRVRSRSATHITALC